MWLLSFLDSSYERAIWWHDKADVVLVLALVIGVVATYVSIRTGNTKEEYLKGELAITNARAEEAIFAYGKLKAQLTWRRLTPEQLKFIIDRASALKWPNVILPIKVFPGDVESKFFAGEISKALTTAGIKTRVDVLMYSGSIHTGISFCMEPESMRKYIEELRNVFIEAGFAIGAAPEDFNMFCIIVGPRPMPEF
jgi:hypothetical protein